MKFEYYTFWIVYSLSQVYGSTKGNQKVSFHDYKAILKSLDLNPVFCGVLGLHLDIKRITAVKGLTLDDCGACLKVTSIEDPKVTEYVMAIDQGGKGLDLNGDSFAKLTKGRRDGLVHVKWEKTNSEHCKDIVTGEYELPGYTRGFDLPKDSEEKPNSTETVTSPTPIDSKDHDEKNGKSSKKGKKDKEEKGKKEKKDKKDKGGKRGKDRMAENPSDEDDSNGNEFDVYDASRK